ncbi:MAG TPA: hypothetical protein VES39_05850 [Rhodospirillales bacterium]|nr:hypothetical protein [Rhodospirillales bacterium]
MRWRRASSGMLLLSGLALSGCLAGERPPIWSIYGDPTTQAPVADTTAVVFDQRIEVYSLPAFSLKLGGFQAYYDPYPYFVRYPYPWYATTVPPRVFYPRTVHPPIVGPGRPPFSWRSPAAPKTLGIRRFSQPSMGRVR